MSPSKLLVWLLIVGLLGCQSLTDLRFQSPEKEADDEEPLDFETKVETPLIGDYITFSGLNPVVIEGVGLVTGLRGTGGDPLVSMYRTALLNEMRIHEVPRPETLMQSPNTALVIVRAYLPPLLAKGETFDVEVFAPESARATSLAGGWLLPARLREHAVIPGKRVLEGDEYGSARGPILVSALDTDSDENSGGLLRGRILGGGVVKMERELSINLRNDFRGTRMTQRVADAIGRRFNYYNEHGLKRNLAEAKNDQKIVLHLPPVYKNNYPHFLQVVRHIAFREDAVGRRVRMQQLQRELQTPATSQKAAWQLEAIGDDAIPTLKAGLKADSLECRFYAAEALAYMGEIDGLDVLAEAARNEPAFRVFALAAIAALDDASCHVVLRDLMNETSAETRYGAFRALWTIDKDDPFIRGEDMNGHFMLHVLKTEGEPMIHLTRHQRSEVVIFGDRQRFHVPLYLQAGKDIMLTAQAGSDTVTVTRFDVSGHDQKRIVSTEVADVIRAAAELGATYPDIAQMLVQASKQHNAPGLVALDALPRAGRTYIRPQPDGKKGDSTRIGGSGLVPNMFPNRDDDEPEPTDLPSLDEEAPAESGTASMTDARTAKDKPPEEKPAEEKAVAKKSATGKSKRGFGPFRLPSEAELQRPDEESSGKNTAGSAETPAEP